MKATDQPRAAIAGLSIGDAVVVDAALAGLGAGGRNIRKPKLRSQDMKFTLVAMPAHIGGFSKTKVCCVKWIVRRVHRTSSKVE
jgi:hypothetical protein